MRIRGITGKVLYSSKITTLSRTLEHAVRSGADLHEADLRGADLHGADLQDANLQGAILRGADLHGAKLPHYAVHPDLGSFIGYKKLTEHCIAQLLIPDDAKRVQAISSRKCRASYVKVLRILDINDKDVIEAVPGLHDKQTLYKVGETVFPSGFNDDIRIECAEGIHFFITYQEAKEY